MHYGNFGSAILSFSHLCSQAFCGMFFIIELAKGDILNKAYSKKTLKAFHVLFLLNLKESNKAEKQQENGGKTGAEALFFCVK